MAKRLSGRPKKYDNDFYIQIVKEHDDFSLSQMAENHNVSISTAAKWLAKGRAILQCQKQTNTTQV